MSTRTATYKSAELGRTVELTSYVDPHPGKTGTDRVPAPCSRCSGRGYFDCYGHIFNGRCFQCGGNGQGSISVATARKHARHAAYLTEFAAERAEAQAVARAAAERAAAEAEFAAAYDAAVAENTRRAAMVQGFLGEAGDKITFTGTVTVAKYNAGSYNRSSSMFLVFTTDAGQVVKGFSSSKTVFALKRGDRVAITAKVKGHDAYQGQDQTTVTAIKAEKLESVQAA
jgi:hypothetical protein